MAGYRIDRVSEDIKREIIAVIRELKDPRVMDKMLTVVRVEVSSDASYAKVYISAMEGIDTAKEAVKGLKSATGYIRREVGKRLHLRKTPELSFVADDSIEHGMNIVKIMDEKKKEALVIVDDKNSSLAIGKKGQNVKLASRLTRYKIEIKNVSEVSEDVLESDNSTTDSEVEKHDSARVKEENENADAVSLEEITSEE